MTKVFIADWIAAYAALKLKFPLWRPSNAYARVLFAAIKVVLKPEVEVCVEESDVKLERDCVAYVKAVWIAVRLVYSELRVYPEY